MTTPATPAFLPPESRSTSEGSRARARRRARWFILTAGLAGPLLAAAIGVLNTHGEDDISRRSDEARALVVGHSEEGAVVLFRSRGENVEVVVPWRGLLDSDDLPVGKVVDVYVDRRDPRSVYLVDEPTTYGGWWWVASMLNALVFTGLVLAALGNWVYAWVLGFRARRVPHHGSLRRPTCERAAAPPFAATSDDGPRLSERSLWMTNLLGAQPWGPAWLCGDGGAPAGIACPAGVFDTSWRPLATIGDGPVRTVAIDGREVSRIVARAACGCGCRSNDDLIFVASAGEGSLHVYRSRLEARRVEVRRGVTKLGDATEESARQPATRLTHLTVEPTLDRVTSLIVLCVLLVAVGPTIQPPYPE